MGIFLMAIMYKCYFCIAAQENGSVFGHNHKKGEAESFCDKKTEDISCFAKMLQEIILDK